MLALAVAPGQQAWAYPREEPPPSCWPSDVVVGLAHLRMLADPGVHRDPGRGAGVD